MTLHPHVIGIDIAKRTLDGFDQARGQGWRLPNTPEAVANLVQSWAGCDVLVVFEATGSYDAVLRHALTAAGVAFARVNPARARDFARATGRLAKTDAIDARLLALMGAGLALAPSPAADPDRERLALLHKRRDQLVATRQEERTRLAEIEAPQIEASLQAHLAWLDQAIRDLEEAIRQALAASQTLREAERLLRSAPGVGPVTATTLLALMPELGARSGGAVAALAGLAPFNADSGQHRGTRRIQGGRRRVRQALYMAAVTAARISPPFADLYQRLCERGKPAKLALIAVARKLLVTLNALLKTKIPFHA